MSKVTFEISMSLDGFLAGPDPSLDAPLGREGERLHEWVVRLESWRARHGHEGGARDADSELLEQSIANVGATIMGRRMFSSGEGPWEADARAGGWWGDDPPFRMPVFVLTHHEREPLVLGETTFTFVTDGIEPALEQARDAAGGQDVAIAGGADVAQQYLRAGLVDELLIHVAPLLLGGGTRVFGDLDAPVELEPLPAPASPNVTHLRYRVRR